MEENIYDGQVAIEITASTVTESTYAADDPCGMQTSFDLYGCNPDTIRNVKKIKRFVYRLCKLIGMKRYGNCRVVNFGEDERVAGYSMTQLIETSLISAHFANASNTVYLDVFSCKYYDPEIVEEFAKEFFEGDYCIRHVNLRK